MAEVVGKPEKTFFNAALSHLNSTIPLSKDTPVLQNEGTVSMKNERVAQFNYHLGNKYNTSMHGFYYLINISEVLMVGDDIRDDVLGAQDAGFQVQCIG